MTYATVAPASRLKCSRKKWSFQETAYVEGVAGVAAAASSRTIVSSGGAASASASSAGESPCATPGGRRKPTKDLSWWIFARSRLFRFGFFVGSPAVLPGGEKEPSTAGGASDSASNARISASTENGACNSAAVSRSKCLSGNRATRDSSEHRRLHSRAAPVTMKSNAKRG